MTITNVLGSASWTHKHDGDNTLKFFKQYLLMLVWGQTGSIVVKSKRKFWNGDKQDIFFTRKIQIDRPSRN